MSFVHPLLLAGLVLAGLPILIHLIMQQKPKRLPFPAFRFLLQKHRTNQRKLRIRHLLLLLLRISLIALLCLALARPRLFSEGLINLSSDRPASVVLLFDTSMSMEYTAGAKNRLDEAKRRAMELLDQLPDGSQVALLDTAELGGEWQSVNKARDQVNGLRLRPGNHPLTRQLGQAVRLFDMLPKEERDAPPWFLYLFSDRTQESWDEGEARSITLPPGVNALFVDVGLDKVSDLAIANLDLPRQVLGPEDPLEVRVTVQATGADYDTFLTCRIDDEPGGERKPVKLKAGDAPIITFDRNLTKLGPGTHRLEVKLGSNDSMPFDNARFATFEIRTGRKALAIADNVSDARIWKLALDTGGFRCDLVPTARASTLDVKEMLANYKVVALVNVLGPDNALWSVLEEYVRKGGNLVIVPGADVKLDAYNEDPAGKKLMPGQLKKLITAKAPGYAWNENDPNHPFLAPFREWRRTSEVGFFRPDFFPRVLRYWEVERDTDDAARTIVTYASPDRHPALLERNVGPGRVLLFTTGFDGKRDANQAAWWNNYLEADIMFYPVVVTMAARYMAGDLETNNFSYICGAIASVSLPLTPWLPLYTLQGPGLVGNEGTLTRPEGQNVVSVPQAVSPGNYQVFAEKDRPVVGFSLNVRAEECQLARVPAERIEMVLGPDTVLALDRDVKLLDVQKKHWRQPMELLPWLMLGLLIALALENFLANRFYKKAPGDDKLAGQELPAVADASQQAAERVKGGTP